MENFSGGGLIISEDEAPVMENGEFVLPEENDFDLSQILDGTPAMEPEEPAYMPVANEDNLNEILDKPVLQNNIDETPFALYETVEEMASFNYGTDSAETEFMGNSVIDVINVNVASDLLNWKVEFENGEVMSLNDLKNYQAINGKMPNNSGIIKYKNKKLQFSSVKAITIYNPPQFFNYGYKAA